MLMPRKFFAILAAVAVLILFGLVNNAPTLPIFLSTGQYKMEGGIGNKGESLDNDNLNSKGHYFKSDFSQKMNVYEAFKDIHPYLDSIYVQFSDPETAFRWITSAPINFPGEYFYGNGHFFALIRDVNFFVGAGGGPTSEEGHIFPWFSPEFSGLYQFKEEFFKDFPEGLPGDFTPMVTISYGPIILNPEDPKVNTPESGTFPLFIFGLLFLEFVRRKFLIQ